MNHFLLIKPKGSVNQYQSRSSYIKNGLLLFLFASTFAISFFACNDDPNTLTPHDIKNQNSIITGRSVLDIKGIHDEYCQLILDSITYWRAHSTLNSRKVAVVWNIIKTKMAVTLGVPVDTIQARLTSMGITSSNFTHLYSLSSAHLPSVQAVYLDSLLAMVNRNYRLSDAIFVDSINAEISTWSATMTTDQVSSMKAIATSTFVFWKNNYSPIIAYAAPCSGGSMAGRLGVEDAAGGLWGLIGGPAGALLGAVGGTLGGAIVLSIWGC